MGNWVPKICAKFGWIPRTTILYKSFIVLRCMWKEPAPFILHDLWSLGQFPTTSPQLFDGKLRNSSIWISFGLCTRVLHWAVEICWRMNLQMTKATTMQSCGQTIRMGGWQWPQGIRERTRHIKVKHHHWVMPSHWKEWIGANARLSHNIVCEPVQSHW